jgi:hypothetical protein
LMQVVSAASEVPQEPQNRDPSGFS